MTALETTKDVLADRLYLAATGEIDWQEFMADLLRRYRACWFALMETENTAAQSANGVGKVVRAELQMGAPKEVNKLYADYYGALDPWMLATKERRIFQWIGPGSALCPRPQLERTEFFNDYLRHYPARHGLMALLPPMGGGSLVLVIWREQHQGDYEDSEIREFEALVPHFRQAVQIHGKIAGLRQLAESTGALLASLDLGVIALDGNGKICFANGPAEAILRSGDLLRLRDGRLGAPLARETLALRKLTEAAASMRVLFGRPQSSNLTLHSGERTLHLTVMPLATPLTGMPDQANVLVTITFEAPPQRRDRSLATLFGLTPAEIRVSMLLLEGLEPKEIAERIGASYETIRFQLKTIYRKMGVTRQSQVVRLLSRLPGR